MACNFHTFSLTCVMKVAPPSLEPVTLNTQLNYRNKSSPKTLSTVAREITPTTRKFGKFGGRFVAEVVIAPLAELESQFNSALHDHEFKMELAAALKDYAGRETPLYHAEKLTDYYKNMNGDGPEIYLKREDLSHGGSYKMTNVVAQAILAKRMGRKSIITVTSAGHHGVAAAAVCARFSLDSTVYIGTKDMLRKPSIVQHMELDGAQFVYSPTNGYVFSKYAEDVLMETIAEICGNNLQKCVGIVSDKFKMKALKNLENQHHWMVNLSCQYRGVSKLVQDFVKELPVFKNVIDGCYKVANFVNMNSQIRDSFLKYQFQEFGRSRFGHVNSDEIW